MIAHSLIIKVKSNIRFRNLVGSLNQSNPTICNLLVKLKEVTKWCCSQVNKKSIKLKDPIMLKDRSNCKFLFLNRDWDNYKVVLKRSRKIKAWTTNIFRIFKVKDNKDKQLNQSNDELTLPVLIQLLIRKAFCKILML